MYCRESVWWMPSRYCEGTSGVAGFVSTRNVHGIRHGLCRFQLQCVLSIAVSPLVPGQMPQGAGATWSPPLINHKDPHVLEELW